VYEQTKAITFEVIVIDNASSDDSAEMVKEEFPQAFLIENSENSGFAAANNQGIVIAKGRYVLLLNSDTIILDDVIKKTVLFADAHREAAVVGCRVLNADKTLQQTCFMFPSVLNMLLAATYLSKLFPQNRFFGREYMTWWDGNDVREVDVVAGCFMLVRREAAQQVGVLDNRYFVYGEETDWCYRFKQAGWNILYTPEAEIIHYGGQTSQQLAREFRWQLEGSQLIFMKLHKGEITFLAARLLTALFLLLRIPYHFGIGLFAKTKRKPSFETAKTYWLGAYYCIVNWTRLLINAEVVKDKLREKSTN
jgi:GT2 family glycosyltransferase